MIVCVSTMVISSFGCFVSWMCSYKRTKKGTTISSKLLHCECYFRTVWVLAPETKEDWDFVACVAEKGQTDGGLLTDKQRLCWSYCEYTKADRV